jgi:hypothetical protein
VEKSELEITRNNTLYEIAKSIKSNNTLMLPNNNEVSTLLQSELEKALKEDSFRIDSFVNFLSTNQFGRFIKDREFQSFFFFLIKSGLKDWVGWVKWIKKGYFRHFAYILLVFNRK